MIRNIEYLFSLRLLPFKEWSDTRVKNWAISKRWRGLTQELKIGLLAKGGVIFVCAAKLERRQVKSTLV